MSEELREQIRNDLNLKDIYELLDIWRTNNRVAWSDTTFEVLEEILKERIREIPPQEEPVLEPEGPVQHKDRLEDWETKLLENENQPELYKVREILTLRQNVNKVAVAVIVVNILLGLLNIEFIRAFLLGIPVSSVEIMQSLPSTTIAVTLSVGLQIVIVYFPLKALAQILRILMEMEFNSRRAKV